MGISSQKRNHNCIDLLYNRERELEFILDLSDSIRNLSDPMEIERIITRKTRKYFKANICYYGEICGDKMIIRQDLSGINIKSIVGKYDMSVFPNYKFLVDSGEAIVVNNVYCDLLIEEGLRELFIGLGIISYIIVPIKKDNNIVGILLISQSQPYGWTDNEVRLVADVAERTWNAVERTKIVREKEKLLSQLIKEQEMTQAIIRGMDADVWITDNLGNLTTLKSTLHPKFECKDKPVFEIMGELDYLVMDREQINSKKDMGLFKVLRGEKEKQVGIIKYLHNDNNNIEYRENRISPIKDKDGSLIGAIGLTYDITERKEMEEALVAGKKEVSKLVEELRKNDELRLRFLSSLSHELRNPLATITMGLDYMDYIRGDRTQEDRIIETLKRQTNQLSRLVDDLLNMTRIAQNRFHLKLGKVELNTLLEETIKDNYIHFNEKRIQVELKMARDRLYIEGDGVRLKQVIENILNNATKFTPVGGRVCIKLKIDGTTNKAIISIRDTGEGMSKEVLENIFEPFVQAKNDFGECSAGLGIGLSIAKEIIEKHKGYIKVFSPGKGKGTRFTIGLPILYD